MGAVITAAVLLALLIAVGIAFAWQERRFVDDRATTYSVEDSIRFVTERLSPEARARIGRHDVRRILEWDVRYLQDASARLDPDAPVVVGGLAAAAYAQERAYEAGFAYEPDVVLEVVQLRGAYLAAIGVVGEAVEDDGGGQL